MNNYDTNSNGLSIEISVFYNHDLSRHYFDDQLSILTDGKLLQFESLPDKLIKSFKPTCNKLQLIEFLEYHSDYFNREDNHTYSELQDEVLNLNVEAILSGMDGLPYWYDAHSPKLDCKFNINFQVVTGYSQGDEVLVVYEVSDEYEPDNQTLENLIYCSPITLIGTIEEFELSSCDILDDCYKYEKSDVIKGILTACQNEDFYNEAELTKELESLLPSSPDQY